VGGHLVDCSAQFRAGWWEPKAGHFGELWEQGECLGVIGGGAAEDFFQEVGLGGGCIFLQCFGDDAILVDHVSEVGGFGVVANEACHELFVSLPFALHVLFVVSPVNSRLRE
jgi:hypothetical protein